MKIGLLLPHFGRHATTSRLLDGVAEIDRLGYDSVWVRDHLVYRPHPFEDDDWTFLEPFTVLSAAAARSRRLMLGTATLIPYRHPIHTALLLASLARYAGEERLLICWGIGNDPREFAAAESPGTKRGARLDEHVAVVRELLSGRTISHHGQHYTFSDVRMRAPDRPLSFWYGGGSVRAMHRTVSHFDGLLASRIPRATLRQRIHLLEELSAAAGRGRPEVGVVTLVSPAATVEQGMAAFDVERIRADTERRFPGFRSEHGSGLDGVMVAGPADRIAEEVLGYATIGVSHLVLDLRARFEEWEALIDGFARDVLPYLKEATR
jgi:alkanesulfonate monooxygenase SsuD/methylene tetrahydromethanopterin reductase-like flavin-dependent oxidoreductase (luciferase family)